MNETEQDDSKFITFFEGENSMLFSSFNGMENKPILSVGDKQIIEN